MKIYHQVNGFHPRTGKKHKVDVYAFLQGEYHFADGACSAMMRSYINELDFAWMCVSCGKNCLR